MRRATALAVIIRRLP